MFLLEQLDSQNPETAITSEQNERGSILYAGMTQQTSCGLQLHNVHESAMNIHSILIWLL